MAFIKHISELPTWFNIDKYQTSHEKYSAESFLQQLIYRISLVRLISEKDWLIPVKIKAKQYDEYTVYDFGCIPYILIDDYEKTKIKNITPQSIHWDHYTSIIKYAMRVIEVDPLLEQGFGILDEDYHYAWIYCIRDTLAIFRNSEIKPISDLSIYDLGEMFTMLPNQLSQYLKFEFKEVHENNYYNSVKEHLDELGMSHALEGIDQEKEDEQSDGISWDYIKSLSDEDFMDLESMSQKQFLDYQRENTHTPPIYIRPTIKVDLMCSDSVLKEQFDGWLKQQRQNLYKLDAVDQINIKPIVKKTGQNLLNKLINYKVLAYLDLYIWSVLNNHKIKKSVLAHALYLDEYDSDFVRKILIPKINKLFNQNSPEIAELFAYKNMEDFKQ